MIMSKIFWTLSSAVFLCLFIYTYLVLSYFDSKYQSTAPSKVFSKREEYSVESPDSLKFSIYMPDPQENNSDQGLAKISVKGYNNNWKMSGETEEAELFRYRKKVTNKILNRVDISMARSHRELDPFTFELSNDLSHTEPTGNNNRHRYMLPTRDNRKVNTISKRSFEYMALDSYANPVTEDYCPPAPPSKKKFSVFGFLGMMVSLSMTVANILNAINNNNNNNNNTNNDNNNNNNDINGDGNVDEVNDGEVPPPPVRNEVPVRINNVAQHNANVDLSSDDLPALINERPSHPNPNTVSFHGRNLAEMKAETWRNILSKQKAPISSMREKSSDITTFNTGMSLLPNAYGNNIVTDEYSHRVFNLNHYKFIYGNASRLNNTKRSRRLNDFANGECRCKWNTPTPTSNLAFKEIFEQERIAQKSAAPKSVLLERKGIKRSIKSDDKWIWVINCFQKWRCHQELEHRNDSGWNLIFTQLNRLVMHTLVRRGESVRKLFSKGFSTLNKAAEDFLGKISATKSTGEKINERGQSEGKPSGRDSTIEEYSCQFIYCPLSYD
ncbi:hypothetical protein SK128_026839 [Halocaridina rubra]|uniref:Uncharacterized protein n=1 Tax=Halocaridina rubra TaxID=373956 RepID=A0AAN9A5F5_HALRR